MCFFKDQKQQCIQLVQAHGDQAVTLQMLDESFHDANEENIPSDDDFVHNYMIHVQESSIQQKQQYAVTNATAKFKWLQQIVEVKFSPYDTNSVYMDAYVGTGADVNLILKNRYVKIHNDDRLRHIMPSDIKLGVWGDDQIALLSNCNIYLVHPDTKKPVQVTFYVADKSGSTLLSCATSLKLDLIKVHPKLGIPPPRAKIITSQADQTSPAAKRVTQGKVVFDEMESTVQEPSVIEKQVGHQNNQHDKMSSLVPRSNPYECSKCAEWPKHLTIQPHCSTPPFKGEPLLIEK